MHVELRALFAFAALIAISVVLSATATASGAPPVVNAGGNRTLLEDTAYTFSCTATDPEFDPLTYTWDINGNLFFSQNVLYTFPNPGVFTARCYANDGTTNASNAATITVDMLVSSDTTWDGSVTPAYANYTLPFNITVINGATFTIRNAGIWNNTFIASITVLNGRLVVENSMIQSLSASYGFRISGTAAPGNMSIVMVNSSTIRGIFGNIVFTNGTISAKDSTFMDPRTGTTNILWGQDSNIYLTNVIINGSTLATAGAVRANYSSLITLFALREVIIENLATPSISRTPFLFSAVGVVGRVDVTLRQSTLNSLSTLSATRGVDIALGSASLPFVDTTGTFTFNLRNLDIRNVRGGAVYAVHNRFNGPVDYTLMDSQLGNSTSGSGLYFQFSSSSSRPTISMTNITSVGNGQTGITYRFESSSSISSSNTAAISMSQMVLTNNNNDGIYTLINMNVYPGLDPYPSSRTNLTWSLDGNVSNNRNRGLAFDTYYSTGSSVAVRINNPSTIAFNLYQGIYVYSYYQRVNMSFDLTGVTLSNNTNGWGFYGYLYDTAGDMNTAGSFSLNLTRSHVDGNSGGILIQQQFVSANITGVWRDTTINNNSQQGVYVYSYAGVYYYNGLYMLPWSNLSILADNVSVSGNVADGFYINNYASGYTDYNTWDVYIASSLVAIALNNSHVDDSLNGRGIYSNMYGYNGAPQLNLSLTGGTTVSRNSQQGIYHYMYAYLDSGGGFGGITFGTGTPKMIIVIANASITQNGGTSTDGYGLWITNPQAQYADELTVDIFNGTITGNGGGGIRWGGDYDYTPYSPMKLMIRYSNISDNGGPGVYWRAYQPQYVTSLAMTILNTVVTGNAGTGVDFMIQYGYYNGAIEINVRNSTISDNAGRGFHSYIYNAYQSSPYREHIENTTITNNDGEGILHEYPGSSNRYNTPWTVEYINNTIDGTVGHAISSMAAFSSPTYGYGGAEAFNISGNRITNATGAAVAWSFEPPATGQQITVDFSNNYIADTEEGVTLGISGAANSVHSWRVNYNTLLGMKTTALIISMTNIGTGASGTLQFEKNVFRNSGATAFALIQSNIRMGALNIKDCVFDTQRTGMILSNLIGSIDNATFINSLKEDVQLTDGLVEVHNTKVDPAKLRALGSGAFNVYFHLKVHIAWSGSLIPVIGAVAQYEDALGLVFFITTVQGPEGLPDLELWSYTKSSQGVLGRSPFTVEVSYFDITQREIIPLFESKIVTIKLRDNVLPTVVISTPTDGFSTKETTVQLSGAAYDSGSGFLYDPALPQLAGQFLQVSSDGTTWYPANIRSSSTFEIQFDYTFTDLPETLSAIYVRVFDLAGNNFTRVIPVTVDQTDPVVTILAPITTGILITNAQTIHLAVETEVGTLIFVNGIPPLEVFTRPDLIHVFFEMDLQVFEGPNTISVAAIDKVGNQGNASIRVDVDRQPPYLVLIQPKLDALVNTVHLNVLGQTERTGVTVTVNGVAAPVVDGNFSSDVTLTIGINRIDIVATDAAGNVQNFFREVRYDNVPPWISIQSPKPDALLSSAEVDVVGIVEPGSQLIVNDEVISTATGAFERRILLTEGDNVILFEATDLAGNYLRVTRTVTVDTELPTIRVDSPANEALWNKTTVFVTGQVSDAHTPTLRVNGAAIIVNADGTFSVPVELFEGTNFITLEGIDGAGNTNTKVLTVIRDTNAPYLLPELEGGFFDNGVLTTQNQTATVKGFAEKGSLLEVCYQSRAGLPTCNTIPLQADGSFRTFADLRPLEKNVITVSASDAAGNKVTRSFEITQAPATTVAPTPPNYGLFGLFGVGLILLGAAMFLILTRRRRGGEPVELEGSGEMPGYYTPPAPGAEVMPGPEMSGELGPPAMEVTPAPLEEPGSTEPTMAPGEEIPAAPSRARVMRRRPGSGAEGGAEGTNLTGMGAEEEALPGEVHQSESREG